MRILRVLFLVLALSGMAVSSRAVPVHPIHRPHHAMHHKMTHHKQHKKAGEKHHHNKVRKNH